MTYIHDAEDFALLQRDSTSWTRRHLDWNGRLYITGYDGDSPDDWTPTHCTSHSLADIREAHEFLGAVIERLERES